ncbi:MAG: LD-carboxypeptidase [Alphaproteobacteria bacterium]|nr:LD-carboxypeptidase [Alphaproteobacteria bacterium]
MKKLIFTLLVSTLAFIVDPVVAMDTLEAPRSIGRAPTWEFLGKGDRIDIIVPSGAPLNSQQLPAAKDLICQQGFQAYLSEDAINIKNSPYEYYANSHDERAKYFMNALTGEGKALWALRGGFGGIEVVTRLKRTHFTLPQTIKPIIGFSDITALHLYAAANKWPTLHGPCIGLGEELYSVTQSGVNKSAKLSSLFSILTGDVTELTHSFEVIHPGSSPSETPISGSVMGGNLTLIENHKGTPIALDGKGRFIFFEDTTEDGKRLSRRLEGLLSAGVFNEAKGLIAGNNPITGFENSQQATKDVLKRFVQEELLPEGINIPVVYSPRFGHGEYNDVMPLGTTASLLINRELATLKVSVHESAYK